VGLLFVRAAQYVDPVAAAPRADRDACPVSAGHRLARDDGQHDALLGVGQVPQSEPE
jgi:hypothetical protein